ncbi:MAG: hypothetical protein ABI629_09265 [bacterium]
MADRDLLQRAIAQPGQSQDERLPPELSEHFVDIDERTTVDLLAFTRALAGRLRYHGPAGSPADWSSFFPPSSDPAVWTAQAAEAPHLALLLAFLELYRTPQAALNRFTTRHLDFYYRRVLRFTHRPAVPDRAHVLVELKKHTPPIAIGPQHRLAAGKDAEGVELVYAPVRETVIGPASVASLRSIFVDPRDRGTVRCAPIADSADGAGAPYENGDAQWPAFGNPALSPGTVGFAVGAPILRLCEGTRTISLILTLVTVGASAPRGDDLAASFDFSLTGEKGWLTVDRATASVAGDRVTLVLHLDEADGAVVDYDPALHGYQFATSAPVLLATLKAGAALGYDDLRVLALHRVQIGVEVKGITSLALENDHGRLDPRKVFFPFGPQPTVGSRFMVGCPEAFGKALSSLKLQLHWHGVGRDLASHYADYSEPPADNTAFGFVASWRDAGNVASTPAGSLFNPQDAAAEQTLDLGAAAAPPRGRHGRAVEIYALHGSGSAKGQAVARAMRLFDLRFEPLPSKPPEARSGYLTLALARDFLHDAYRRESIANAVKGGTDFVPLPEPYTPAIRAIALDYVAASKEVDLSAGDIAAFSAGEVRFFHVSCFGQRREHAYLRANRPFAVDANVGLLPSHARRGELLIGLRELRPNDAVSLLFQVVEGSADPDAAREAIEWSVLSDNHWQPLAPEHVDLDTTDGLLASGLVRVVIPATATSDNTLLPSGLLWLRAAVAGNVNAVCRLRTVAANAVEVELRDPRPHPPHLGSALPAGRLTRLKTAVAGVKAIAQPYASFAGAAAETDRARNTRAAERLRHRDRCLTAWDYERIVLDAFPGVHTVKCIPHAGEGSWQAPGHVLLVVVPDLRNRQAVDPLQPKVDLHTLQRIRAHVAARADGGDRARHQPPLPGHRPRFPRPPAPRLRPPLLPQPARGRARRLSLALGARQRAALVVRRPGPPLDAARLRRAARVRRLRHRLQHVHSRRPGARCRRRRAADARHDPGLGRPPQHRDAALGRARRDDHVRPPARDHRPRRARARLRPALHRRAAAHPRPVAAGVDRLQRARPRHHHTRAAVLCAH